MKKSYFIQALCFLGLLSCDYGDKFDGFKEDLVGGTVQAVYVSPSSYTLYIDSELPTMYAYVAPTHAADTSVSWVSDHPEILSVNAQTGELSWGTISNSEVIVSAISNSNSEAVGTCVFTIRNARNNYGYVDARSTLGLWILDRNIGASEIPNEDATWSFPPADRGVPGNYYQWGNSTPLANIETGGRNNNGWGDSYPYYESDGRLHNLNSGLPGVDPYYSADSETFVDWTNASNLPGGMDGWRLPTKEELEELAYWMNEENFRNAEDKSKARVLWKELGFAPTASIRLYWTGYLDWQVSGFCRIQSSDYDPATQKAWCLEIYGSNAASLVEVEINNAMPIRLVRDANTFDGEEGVENEE